MYEDPSARLERSIANGVGYLTQAVEADGAWPSSVFSTNEPMAGVVTHHPPFVAALGAMSLAACRHPDAASLRGRTLAFLRATMEPTGLWRYADFVPPDADDSALCSLALAAAENPALAAAPRDGAGRFRTWIPSAEEPVTLFNEPDAAVNANVIACLGDRPETRAAQGWLAELMGAAPDARQRALHYYPHALDLWVAISRAGAAQPPVMQALRQPLLRQILACQDATGTFGDVLRTAQALTALDRLGAGGRVPVVRPAVERLLAAQEADGSWPPCLAWVGGPGQPFGFEAATLTTACSVEALGRVMGQDGPAPPLAG